MPGRSFVASKLVYNLVWDTVLIWATVLSSVYSERAVEKGGDTFPQRKEEIVF